MPAPSSRESLIYEARARIIWGDAPEEVAEWLASQGVEEEKVRQIVWACLKERRDEVRRKGLAELLIGALITTAGAFGIGGMHFVGIVHSKAFALFILVGLYGLYRAGKGLVYLVSGHRIPGSLTEMDEGL